jgi:hypothetical protein
LVRFFSTLQGFWCFLIAGAVFWFSAPLVQEVDPTAGVWDRGSIHGLAIGAATYFLAVWLAWLAFQIEWPSLDGHIDSNKWAQDWRVVTPQARLWYSAFVWATLFLGAILCLLAWR